MNAELLKTQSNLKPLRLQVSLQQNKKEGRPQTPESFLPYIDSKKFKQVTKVLNLYYFRVSSRQQNDFHLQDTHHPQFQESNEYSNNAINPIH